MLDPKSECYVCQSNIVACLKSLTGKKSNEIFVEKGAYDIHTCWSILIGEAYLVACRNKQLSKRVKVLEKQCEELRQLSLF